MQTAMASEEATGKRSSPGGDDVEERKIRLEQYKLFVQMADSVSASRSRANTFYQTVHTGLYGAYLTFLLRSWKDLASVPGVLVVLPFLLLSFLCVVWWYNIRSYQQLNAAKLQVVGRMEQKLPEQPYAEEWALLGQGLDKQRYWPVSHLESWIAVGMLVCNVATIVLLIVTPKT